MPGTVDAYVAKLSPEQARIVESLRTLVKGAAPIATEGIKWGRPVYEVNGPFCWIKANRAHVTLGFWRGKDLESGKGLIESSGEKMAHVKVRTVGEAQAPALRRMVREAARVNEAPGDPKRRRPPRKRAASARSGTRA